MMKQAGARRLAASPRVKVRGLAKVQAVFTFAILAYNLVQVPKLLQDLQLSTSSPADYPSFGCRSTCLFHEC
jgi:hypothetical protein